MQRYLWPNILYMERVLTYLRENYKTVENYLLAKGNSESEIQRLRKKLLD